VPEEKVFYELSQMRFYVINTSDGGIKAYLSDSSAPLRTYLTASGLLFATLSESAPEFREFFPNLEPLLERVDFTKLRYRRSINYEGNFNWKTM
jgi:hypothetical protein